MPGYLLDTNHATHLLRGDHPLAARLSEQALRDAYFGISMTVLAELYFAVHASQRREENLHNLLRFSDSVLLWAFDQEAAEEFGKIQAEQKQKGRPIPPMDAQIAAVSRVRGLTVLSADRHFRFIDGIRVESWLAAS